MYVFCFEYFFVDLLCCVVYVGIYLVCVVRCGVKIVWLSCDEVINLYVGIFSIFWIINFDILYGIFVIVDFYFLGLLCNFFKDVN